MDPINLILRLQVALLFERICIHLHLIIRLANEHVTMPTTTRTFTAKQPFLCFCSTSNSFYSMGIVLFKFDQLCC